MKIDELKQNDFLPLQSQNEIYVNRILLRDYLPF